MKPALIDAALDTTNPLRQDRSQRKHHHQQQTYNKPLAPDPSSRQSGSISPFGIAWERNPCNPYKYLGPPRFVPKNQMFAVEFRIQLYELHSKPASLIIYFHVRHHPGNKTERWLACEGAKTGQLQRVPLYLAQTGVYNIEIMIVPNNKLFRPAVYQYDQTITVYESDYDHVYVGAYEHKILFGFDKPVPVPVPAGQGNDQDGGKAGTSVGKRASSLSSSSSSSTSTATTTTLHKPPDKVVRYLSQGKEAHIMQWLSLIPDEPEKDDWVEDSRIIPRSASNKSVVTVRRLGIVITCPSDC